MLRGLRPGTLHLPSPRMAIFGYLQVRPLALRILRFSTQESKVSNSLESCDSDVDKRRRLEAVLFLSPRGITSRKAANLAALADATEVRTLVRQLNQFYDCQFKPYRIEEVAGGYAIMTRSRLATWLKKLSYVPGEVRLGRSALETLAIVAYRQPVMRADIEAIRGVGCSEVLKQLMEVDLVRINGRSEDLGRPYLYGTTTRFLQIFGLRSADRLPRIEWVSLTAPVVPTLSSEDFATESELKESTVKRTATTTNFTGEESVDELLLSATATVIPISAIDEEDDDFLDDDDEEDDDDDDFDEEDDDDLDDWEDDEDEEIVDEEEGEEEEVEEDNLKEEEEVEEDDEEEVWEEVGDEEESEDLEEDEEDDDDWDDDDDDDWDEDEDEDEDWE